MGRCLIQAPCGTNQRAIPAMSTPRRRKGSASSSKPWKMAQAVASFSKVMVVVEPNCKTRKTILERHDLIRCECLALVTNS